MAHTIEKSAEIYLKVLSTGKDIPQTITDNDLLAIEPEFHITLNREFLSVKKWYVMVLYNLINFACMKYILIKIALI